MPDGLGLGIYALALLRVAARIIERDQLVTGNTLLPDAGGEEGTLRHFSPNPLIALNSRVPGATSTTWVYTWRGDRSHKVSLTVPQLSARMLPSVGREPATGSLKATGLSRSARPAPTSRPSGSSYGEGGLPIMLGSDG